MTAADDSEAGLTADERAAARAFVARCEVRLSTLHRIAVGMLSGAGLLVVLPVVARDSVTGLLRSLLVGTIDAADVSLVVAVLAILGVPAAALWLLFADLTRFYFHANHLGGNGGEVFTPRFTLTSLRMPSDELGRSAEADLARIREDPRIVELLVPTNDASRAAIDRQLDVYGGLGRGTDDIGRADGLFELAASKSRSLLEEVAKVEYGMARHILKLRGLVLRYVKALLALLTTALAVYGGDAIVSGLDHGDDMTTSGECVVGGDRPRVGTTRRPRGDDAGTMDRASDARRWGTFDGRRRRPGADVRRAGVAPDRSRRMARRRRGDGALGHRRRGELDEDRRPDRAGGIAAGCDDSRLHRPLPLPDLDPHLTDDGMCLAHPVRCGGR